MSTAYPVDGRGRSGSGETQARPKATGKMMAKYALFLNLNEKFSILLIGRWWVGNHEMFGCGFLHNILF